MNQRVVLPLLIVLLAALAGGLWFVFGQAPTNELPEPALGLSPDSSAPQVANESALPAGQALPEHVRVDEDAATTVIMPLELEFELVNAKARLRANGVPPLGSSQTARLRGSMHGFDGTGVVGHVEFIAGPNRGRIIETDSQGSFGANDLFAGLSLMRLVAPGTPGAEREELLRQDRETQLNIGFGRPAQVRGRVRDEENQPLPTAKVVMDGQEALTDEEGIFYFPRMTSGKVPIYVSKPGYATHREMQYITAGMSIPYDKLTYNLVKAARLKVVVPERIGVGRPGELFLSGPLEPSGGRTYPWHLKSPLSIYGGEAIEIDDLPPGRIRLQLFRPGAIAEPSVVEETLVSGREKLVTIHLKAAPILVGKVMSGGKAVEGALVQLEAPDVTSASVQALGGGFGRAKIEMDTLSHMPPAMQRVVSNPDGSFKFSAGEELSPVRYLTAKSRDGRAWGGRAVQAGEREVEIEISEPQGGKAAIVIETTTRFQGLPVKYLVDGKPYFAMLPAGERLEIENLPEGEWRVKARWSSERILESTLIQLDGTYELFLPLPQGAIDGQSKSLREAMNPLQQNRTLQQP